MIEKLENEVSSQERHFPILDHLYIIQSILEKLPGRQPSVNSFQYIKACEGLKDYFQDFHFYSSDGIDRCEEIEDSLIILRSNGLIDYFHSLGNEEPQMSLDLNRKKNKPESSEEFANSVINRYIELERERQKQSNR